MWAFAWEPHAFPLYPLSPLHSMQSVTAPLKCCIKLTYVTQFRKPAFNSGMNVHWALPFWLENEKTVSVFLTATVFWICQHDSIVYLIFWNCLCDANVFWNCVCDAIIFLVIVFWKCWLVTVYILFHVTQIKRSLINVVNSSQYLVRQKRYDQKNTRPIERVLRGKQSTHSAKLMDFLQIHPNR